MRIAFASFEYPEETGGGGIGTYLQTVASLLHQQGHELTVFAGTKKDEAWWENDFVYRLPAQNWPDFNNRIVPFFLPVHTARPFDVLECTDFQACGLSIKKALPDLPVVVRLHTPLFLVHRLLYPPLTLLQKLRFIMGSIKKFNLVKLPLPPQPENYKEEFELIELAEMVSSPGRSIKNELTALGFKLAGKTEIVPLPFVITPAFSDVKSRSDISDGPHIVFIGRMEIRKGVIDLAEAVPDILKKIPTAHFTFIGEPSFSPVTGMDMATYLKNKLSRFGPSITFSGKIPRTELLSYLEKGDIFVFPSHYESFGLVCCEAMAAGKAVIGSRCGGMAEIIEDGKSGMLVPPKNVQTLANTVIMIAADNQKRLLLGRAARERIQTYLFPERVMEKQLACYHKAIAKSRLMNAAEC